MIYSLKKYIRDNPKLIKVVAQDFLIYDIQIKLYFEQKYVYNLDKEINFMKGKNIYE